MLVFSIRNMFKREKYVISFVRSGFLKSKEMIQF